MRFFAAAMARYRSEGGDPVRRVRRRSHPNSAVWKCPVDISVSFRRGAIEVVRAENDFERAAPADEMGEAFRTAAARMHSHSDFGLPQSRLLARCETHVAGQDELTTRAPDASSNLRDADHRGLGEKRTNVSIRIGRPEAPTSSHDVPYLAGQIKVGKVELGVRAFEYDDPQSSGLASIRASRSCRASNMLASTMLKGG